MADLASAKSGKKGVRLDSQLYEALKKALYKPAAFFKGILFPLCEVSSGRSLWGTRLGARVMALMWGCVERYIGGLFIARSDNYRICLVEGFGPGATLSSSATQTRWNGLRR